MSESMFINYVLAFAFTEKNKVVLIKKERPFWQAGKMNGIGGISNFGEDIRTSMTREFHEETGVLIDPTSWRTVREIPIGGGKIHVFTIQSTLINNVKTTTDEKVSLNKLPLSVPNPLYDLEALINESLNTLDIVL